MTRHEKWFLALFSLFLILYTTGPYLFGYFTRPEGHTFTWISPLHKNDTHIYYSYIRQAIAGELAFRDFYTTEPQAHGVINIFWLALGIAARFFHLSPALVSQLARILLIPCAVWCIYFFARYLFESPRVRMVAVSFALCAGGFGGYVGSAIVRRHLDEAITTAEFPMDLAVSSGFPYLAFAHSPHFVASYIALFGIMALIFLGVSSDRFRFSLGAGIASFFFFNFHPYFVFPIALIAISFAAVRILCGALALRRGAVHLAFIGIPALPAVLYHVWLTLVDPVIALRNAQNITPTPSFSMVIISYGGLLIGLGMAIALMRHLGRARAILQFIIIAALVNFFLLFSGIPFAVRFVQGLTVFLAFLTVYAATAVFREPLRRVWRRFPVATVIVFVMIFFVTTASRTITLNRFFTQSDQTALEYPDAYPLIYLERDRARVFRWMAQEKLGTLRVLTGVLNGQLIPGETGQIVYAGHWSDTIDPTRKEHEVRQFFKTNDGDDEKYQWLKEKGITHVFYSPLERVYGTYDPSTKSYFASVFESGNVTLYAVK